MSLGRIILKIIKFPDILIEVEGSSDHPRHPVAMQGDGLPAVVVDGPVSEHLIVLNWVGRCGLCLVERILHADAVEWHLFHPVDLGGQL